MYIYTLKLKSFASSAAIRRVILQHHSIVTLGPSLGRNRYAAGYGSIKAKGTLQKY